MLQSIGLQRVGLNLATEQESRPKSRERKLLSGAPSSQLRSLPGSSPQFHTTVPWRQAKCHASETEAASSWVLVRVPQLPSP